MTPLDTFYERVAAHARSLSPERAGVWIAGHGLFARELRGRLPAAVGAELEAGARRNLARNLHWIDAFQRVVDALGDVPVCPLKGIALLGTAYAAEPEARVLTDLDVLVPDGRIDEATTRLHERLGLRDLSTPVERELRHERTLEGDRLAVDVHSRLGIGAGDATTLAALSTVPAILHGRNVLLLPSAETIVYLLGHLVRHGPHSRLAWVEDVLRLAVSPDAPGAAQLVFAATRLGARRALLAGAVAARWLAGEGLWPELDRSLARSDRRRVAWCVGLAWRRQRRDPLGVPAQSPARRFLVATLLAESWRAAAGATIAKLRERTRRAHHRSAGRP